MPLYEFECLECGKVQEELQTLSKRTNFIRPVCHPNGYAVRKMSIPQNNTAMQQMADLGCVFVDQYDNDIRAHSKERFNQRTKQWEKCR